MRTSTAAALSVAGVGVVALICAADPEELDSAPDRDGHVAECVVGHWRGVGVDGPADQSRISGGSGVALSIEPDGNAWVDFDGMAPVDLTGHEVGGLPVTGQLRYTGAAGGTIRTGVDTEIGSWQLAGPVDWSQVRVTLEVVEPAPGVLVEDAPLGEPVDGLATWAGDLIRIAPILTDGDFECVDGMLLLTPADHDGLPWTLSRA